MYMREASDMRPERIQLPESYGGTAFSKGGEALRGIPASASPEKAKEAPPVAGAAADRTPTGGRPEHRETGTGERASHISAADAREPETAAAGAEEYRGKPTGGGEIKASALASGLSGILGSLLQDQEANREETPHPGEPEERREPEPPGGSERGAGDAIPTGGAPSLHRRGLPFGRLLGGLPLDSLFGGVKSFFPSFPGFHMPHFGVEECILLGLAALLFFAPEGDRETALLLCLLVFIG